MNRIYRLVFNTALGIWVAVAENAKGRGKGGRAASALVAVLAIISPSAYAANAADATVVVGSGSVATSGLTTTINQTSQRLAIDWTKLSTVAGEALSFVQPNAQAIALNRITGSSPSTFLGSLTANGQVFIVNPNGILFGAGSQVNVAGLVASTLAMSNADFAAGRNVFTKTTGTGSVVNQGTMTAAQGGYLAMLAPEVRNEGVMTATLGTALLAAGSKVTLNLDNGSLLGYSIDQGAINALAENKQLIKADGGQVLLSAKAMDALTTATVNNTGVIEARTIQNKAGRILLMGDMEYGAVNVGGTLDASAPNGGNGGFIETSAANVSVAAGTRVTTKAASGQSGTWLIDPVDFTIAAGGAAQTTSGIGADTLSTALDAGNVSIATSATTAGNGDIFVNSNVSWSANPSTLTLTAHRDINFNANVTYSGTGRAGLTAQAVRNINVASNQAIAATNGAMDVVFNAATSNAGGIVMNSGSSIATNGGNVTFGGGADPLNNAVVNPFGRGIRLDGASISSGTGAISMRGTGAGGGIELLSGTTVSSTSGNISLTGSGGAFGGAGLVIGGSGAAASISTVDGAITLTGTASNYSSAIGMPGVFITNASVLASGAGSIAVTGTGNWGGQGVSLNDGAGAPLIQTNTGAISVTGTGGLDGAAGVALRGATIRALGAGNIAVTGTGSSSNSDSRGIDVVGTVGGYFSNGGNITIHGTGGAGAADSSGVFGLNNVTTTGTGNIAIVGTGGNGAGGGFGIVVNSNRTIQAAGGNITITGTSYGNNIGLAMGNANVVNSGAGSIDITGNATQAAVTGSSRPTGINWFGSGGGSVGGAGYSGTIRLASSAGNNFGSSFNLPTVTTTGNIVIEQARTDVAMSIGTFTAFDTFQVSGLLSALTPGYASLTLGHAASTAGLAVGPGATLSGLTAPLTLRSGAGGIAIGGAITSTSSLTMQANSGSISASANINVGTFDLLAGSFSQVGSSLPTFRATDFRISGGTFIRALGGDGLSTGTAYQLTDVYGLQGAGSAGMLTNNYKLANNIDASGTVNWNGSAGFRPIAFGAGSFFTGTFDGNHKTISNLTINRSASDFTGLFGNVSGTVMNVGLNNASISGRNFVGGLVGRYLGGSISNSYVSGSISGDQIVGGLVGYSLGNISNSYVTGNITGNVAAGGLVGQNFTTGSISNSYATGSSSAGSGALVGDNLGSVNASFWQSGTAPGIATDSGTVDGVTRGLSSAEFKTAATFTSAGWSASNVGGDGSTWRVYEGNTGPLLRSFMTTGVNIANLVTTYDGFAQQGNSSAAAGVLGSRASARNAGSYRSGYYANQSGPDIIGGDLTINRADLVLSTSDVVKTYDGTTAALGAAQETAGTWLKGSDTTSGGTFAFTDKHAGAGNKTVTTSGVTVNDGNGGNNYNISYADNTTSTIDPANLVLSTSNVSKVYDGGLTAVGAAVATASTVLFGSDTASGGTFAFTDKNAGIGNKTVTTSGVTVNDGNGGNNYIVTYADNTSSTITQKILTVSGLTAANKVYDQGTSAIVSTAGASYAGLVVGDVLLVSATGTFTDKNAATGKTVNLASSYTGADVGNYAITDQATTTANITPKALTVSGVTASNKTYDQTTAATISTAGAVLGGLIAGDVLAVNATGSFTDKNAATGKTVNLTSGYTGADVGNYAITSQAATTADITPKALTVSGITAAIRVYDQSTNASVSTAGAVLGGLIAGDALTVSATGLFLDKNVGTGKTVNLTSGYTGADVGNYAITSQATATANITPKALTVSGVTASNKIYDQTNVATVSTAGAVLSGLIAGDVLTVSSTGVFADKNAASGKTVNLTSGYLGADVNNYAITSQAATTADITPKALTVSGITAPSRVYDKTTNATVSTAGAVLGGLIAGDALTVSATGRFTDKNAATGKTVNLSSGYAGADVGNYAITSQAITTANITRKDLTVTAAAQNKTYDATTAAVLTYTDNRIAGDALSFTSSASFADKNAGTAKTVNYSGLMQAGADAGNYILVSPTSGTSNANITPAALLITANNDTRLAGAPYSGGNGVVYSGLVGGEMASALTGALAYSGSSQGASAAGSYTITPGGLAGSNYAISFNNGTLTLTPASLTVSGAFAGLKLDLTNPVEAYNGALSSFSSSFKSDIAAALGVDTGRINVQSLNSAANDE